MYFVKSAYAKKLIVLLTVVSLSACHPPVTNKLNQSYQHTQSWLGMPVAELLVVKGNPNAIKYLGWNKRAAISSEFWTPELDRFIPLYRDYGPDVARFKNKSETRLFYKTINTDGPWLMTYQYPVRSYRSKLRHCTEYFIIDKSGVIVESGYQGTQTNDLNHCPIPIAHPKLLKQRSAYTFRLPQ